MLCPVQKACEVQEVIEVGKCPGSLSLLEAELSCHFANSVRLRVVEGHLRVAASGGLGFVDPTLLGVSDRSYSPPIT